MKKRFGVFLVLLLLLALLGASVRAADAPTLIVAGNLNDVITLDPARASESTNLTVHHATYDTLLEINADDLTKVVPDLADSYTVSDDGLVYTFKLHPGVKFISGNPVTAEDVRFSWTRLKNMKSGVAFYTDTIAKIEVVDDLTLKVTQTAPFPAFPTVVTAPAMSVTDSKVIKEHGGTDAEDADKTDTAKDWLDQNSAGSGPFTLTKWTPNDEIVMVANPDYWKGAPALGGVTLKNVNDASSALQLVQRGDADVAQGIDADTAEQAKADSNLKLNLGQSLNIFYLAMSPSDYFKTPLSDKRVRQAIAYAIDYDGIINDLLKGYAVRPAAMLPVGVQGSDPSKRYTRDLDKAKALLKDAGYENGFEITLSIGQGTTVGVPRETYAAKIQADLAEVGIKLDIKQDTTPNFLTAFRAQELPMVMSTWTPDYLDATMWSDFFSYPDQSVAMRVRMDIPEIADAAKKAGNEHDPQKRTELYTQYQAAQVDAAVFIPLVQEQYIDVIGPGVEGYVFHPVYFIEFYGISKKS
jgi:peptide/nickel transport system substrate-binding protein